MAFYMKTMVPLRGDGARASASRAGEGHQSRPGADRGRRPGGVHRGRHTQSGLGLSQPTNASHDSHRGDSQGTGIWVLRSIAQASAERRICGRLSAPHALAGTAPLHYHGVQGASSGKLLSLRSPRPNRSGTGAHARLETEAGSPGQRKGATARCRWQIDQGGLDDAQSTAGQGGRSGRTVGA